MFQRNIATKTIFVAASLAVLPLATASSANATPAWQTSITADQVVLVSARSITSTTGTLRTFARDGARWLLIQKPVSVFLGRSGLVPAQSRQQSTGTTPMGIFRLTSAFGRNSDPGTKLPYIRVDANDAWTYNPKIPSTYNLFQSVNRSWKSYGKYVEHLSALGPQYDYVAITDFNQPPGVVTTRPDGVNRVSSAANTERGGGIFLHVSKGIPTAGCVSMNKGVMRSLLRWLEPQAHPVVIIGLEQALMK